MDTKFKVGDTFLRGFAYPTQWEVINTKLIFDIVHYELKLDISLIQKLRCQQQSKDLDLIPHFYICRLRKI